MTDLAVMMRDQARAGLQAQLDAAVTEGNTETARKLADQIAALAVSTAPKTPPYGDAEIRAHLDKQAWFGTDPKRSAKALEFGKTMDPKKFASAEAFAAAIVTAVDDEFKPPVAGRKTEEAEDGEGEEAEGEEGEETEDEDPEKAGKGKSPKPRRTDGPGTADAAGRTARRTTGPWVKLSDAPKEVQTEIKRAADKFVPASAPKERREKYIEKALESHYATHQRKARLPSKERNSR